MKVKRRFPNFFTGFEETEHEVTSKEELLELDWVKNLLEIPNHIGMFYSPKDYPEYPDLLMSLTQGEEKVVYFVVGYIYGDGGMLGLKDYKNYI